MTNTLRSLLFDIAEKPYTNWLNTSDTVLRWQIHDFKDIIVIG